MLSTEFTNESISAVISADLSNRQVSPIYTYTFTMNTRPGKICALSEGGCVHLRQVLRLCHEGGYTIRRFSIGATNRASAKFHYRSPAINIINWAARFAQVLAISLPFFSSSPANLPSRRAETPSTSRIVERIYPRPSPHIWSLSSRFFFKPSAINLTKRQKGDSSNDFNGGWCFAPIIGRRYRDGTPTFYFLSCSFARVFALPSPGRSRRHTRSLYLLLLLFY